MKENDKNPITCNSTNPIENPYYKKPNSDKLYYFKCLELCKKCVNSFECLICGLEYYIKDNVCSERIIGFGKFNETLNFFDRDHNGGEVGYILIILSFSFVFLFIEKNNQIFFSKIDN